MPKGPVSLPVLRTNPLAEIGDDYDDSASVPSNARWSEKTKMTSMPAGSSSGVISSFSNPFIRSKRWMGSSDTTQRDKNPGKPRRDRFRVEAALQRLGTKGHKKNKTSSKSLHNLDNITGARVTDAGHLTGSSADKLAMFEAEQFDVEVFARAHFSSLSEKGVAILRSDLNTLDAECAKEVSGTVHEHYTSFIEACQGIAALEGSMQKLKDLMSVNSLLVGNLRDIAAAAQPKGGSPSLRQKLFDDQEGSKADLKATEQNGGASNDPWKANVDLLNAAFAELDVGMSERRLQESSEKFHAAGDLVLSLSSGMASHPRRPQSAAGTSGAAELVDHPHRAQKQGRLETLTLQADLEARRRRLLTLLDQQIQEPTCSDVDFVLNVKALAALAGEPVAARSMLSAYSAALKRQQMGLLKPLVSGTGGSGNVGVDYAGAVSQRVFSTIGDCLVAFRETFGDKPSLSSLFVTWAVQEVERCGNLLRRHALAAHASAGGVLPSAQCIALSLAYCCRLEQEHGICLGPHLTKNLWPSLESVIQKQLRRIADEVKQMVSEEVEGDRLVPRKAGAEGLPPSATVLAQEIQSLVSDVAFNMLNTPAIARSLRQGISNLFHLYTSTISRTIRKRKKSAAAVSDAADVTSIANLTREIAHNALPGATSGFQEMFGKLCNVGDFERHIADLVAALQ